MRNRAIAVALGALLAAAALVAGPAPAAQAANLSFSISSSLPAGVGIDAPGVEYHPCNDQVGANGTFAKTIPGTAAKIRVELYPGGCADFYNPWGNVGGVHFEVPRSGGNYSGGHVRFPVAPHDGFLIHGDILSSTPVPDGRVTVDTFQVGDFQQNGSVAYGAFASAPSKAKRWTGGVGWSGQYVLFVTDTQTGRKIDVLTTITPNTIPTIDLDAVCFGFANCTYLSGKPGTTAGTFHPTAPTRIVDTRRGLGIINGAVTTGDGRNPDPNPFKRYGSAINHEIQIAGIAGIPAAGVSAVLLNVTAVGAPGPGFISVYPKPPRVGDVYNDQGSYQALPTTSNLNVGGGDVVPNLVLARVGAGGTIRVYNSFGPTDVVVDVAGWFGTGGAHTDGDGFTGVVPDRVLDTRNGIGGPAERVRAGTSRTIDVRNRSGIPSNATSVAINITAVGPSRSGFTTAYPDGTSLPDASNLNYGAATAVRANTAVVKIGANGKIRLHASESDVDLVVDILGSFGPGGGRVTAVDPSRSVDSRHGIGTPRAKFGQFQTRQVQIAGVGPVPSNATAVIANVTATNPTSLGYLTVWPAGSDQPTTSNLNFQPGQSVPNLVLLRLGNGGRLSVFNELGTTDVIIDVMGYVT